MGARRIAVSLLLVLLTVMTFLPVRENEFLTFDDAQYILQNEAIRQGLTTRALRWAFTTFYAYNWHPLTWVSHMSDISIFGLDPRGHHLMNLGLHAAAAVLLWLSLALMTGALVASAGTAAFFAVHPLHVESVAWVAERKDVLSGVCWMLVLLMYLVYARRPSPGRYLAMSASYVLGLMAKPMLVSLPFVLLLLDWWPLGRSVRPGTSGRSAMGRTAPPGRVGWLLIEKLPLLMLAALAALLTYQAQSAGGATRTLAVYPFALRLANAPVSYLTYMLKMLWPSRLAVFYPMPVEGVALLWKAVSASAVLGSITVTVILLARRFPWAAVGWGWYIITLVPVIGLIQVGDQAFADRYTYIPLTGLFLALMWGGRELVRRFPRGRVPLALAAGGLLLPCAAVTRLQLAQWRNDISLFTHALAVAPDNFVARFNLGQALLAKGDLGAAASNLARALSFKPGHKEALNDLGVALSRQRRCREAVPYFQESMTVDPTYSDPYMNLGMAYLCMGDKAGASRTARALQRVDPARAQELFKFVR